jgi:hypothetical protein
MTCHDARESLSAFLDAALEPDERRRVTAHLEGCPECRRELARLEQTVALLRRVEPAHAPVGFVDRVMAAAQPRPWYRRAAAAIFLPFSVKLPAEATALVMVALLAVYLFERTPALQETARPEPASRDAAREKAAAPAARLEGRPVGPSGVPSSESKSTARTEDKARQEAADARGAAPSAPAPSRATPRSDTGAGVPPPAAGVPAAPPPSGQVEAPAESPQAENRQSPAEPGVETPRAAPSAPRLAAKRAAPSADIIAGVAVRDRAVAERDLSELIARVGGRETGRRREEEATVVEAIVPQARYAEFTRSLARLGAWRVEAERPDLPAQIHVILRLQ